MALTPGLVEEDLVSTSWATHPGKNSCWGKLCKEATSHRHITFAYQRTPQVMGQVVPLTINNHQTPLPNMPLWSLDSKISHPGENLR